MDANGNAGVAGMKHGFIVVAVLCFALRVKVGETIVEATDEEEDGT